MIEIGAKRVGLRGQPAMPLRPDPTGAYAAITQRPEAVEERYDDCVDALIWPLFAISSLPDLQAVVWCLVPKWRLHSQSQFIGY